MLHVMPMSLEEMAVSPCQFQGPVPIADRSLITYTWRGANNVVLTHELEAFVILKEAKKVSTL